MKEYLKIKRSFTLIELLVVIAIIALLSSVILVSLSGPRQKAKIAKALEFSQSVQHAIGIEAVGVWNFDDCTAKDLSGYGNNGTINGAVCVDDTPYKIVGSGQGKNALSFDGNDYIDCGSGNSLNVAQGDFSIETWLYPRDVSNYRYIMGKGRYVTDGWEMRVFSNAGIYVYINYAGGNCGLQAPAGTLSINKWQHVVWVKKGNLGYWFLDGKEVISGSVACVAVTSSRIMTIGTNPAQSDYFNGIIDDIRIYSTALSLSEIQQQYLAGLEKHQQLTMDLKNK